MLTHGFCDTMLTKKTLARVALLCAAAAMVVATSGCGYVLAAGAGGAAGYAVGKNDK